MLEIFKKAEEIGNMIKESEAFLRVKNAEIAHENDLESQAIVKEYNEIRQSIAQKMQQETEMTEEKMSEYRKAINEAYEKLMLNDIIKEYIESKKEFDELNQKVFGLITGTGSEGCGGSCSSCSGCH